MTARGTTSPKQVKDYSYFRPDLIASVGEYCSYCEVPLGVNLAVEHMLSKTSSFNAEDWNNLLLACANCNSHKLAKTRSEADLAEYYWPSKRYSNFNTFDMLAYRREAKTVLDLAAAGVFLWPPTSRPRSLYPFTDTQTYDYVWVYPSAAYAADPARTSMIKKTIMLMGLNDFTPDDNDPKASDRRVFNRTTAWIRAEQLASQLERYFTFPPNRVAIALLKEQIKQAAIATGFWSVWMTVFRSHAFVDANTRNQVLREIFLSPNAFPGTVYSVG
jgi:hypothetical protein